MFYTKIYKKNIDYLYFDVNLFLLKEKLKYIFNFIKDLFIYLLAILFALTIFLYLSIAIYIW